jgi:hypothetical protein
MGFRQAQPRFHNENEAKLPPVTEPQDNRRVDPNLTGRVERLAFTAFTIVAPASTVPAMMGWIALKMAANWNKDLPPCQKVGDETQGVDPRDEKIFRNRHAFLAVLSGLVSLGIAFAGGMLARIIMGVGV